PDLDRIIEVAVVVTDMHLNVLAEGPVFAIHQSDETLDKMDAWNKGTHGRSGLIERVKASTVTEADAEAALITFLKNFVPANKSPMCGNTICQDRRFMARGMPKLEAFFHYRNLDVSTLKELCRRWKPEIVGGFKKHQKHTALADIIESVEELKYYREHFIKL
ncbi:MAG: oligoribonuclease, partial [Pseudoxanthomonas sp.]